MEHVTAMPRIPVCRRGNVPHRRATAQNRNWRFAPIAAHCMVYRTILLLSLCGSFTTQDSNTAAETAGKRDMRVFCPTSTARNCNKFISSPASRPLHLLRHQRHQHPLSLVAFPQPVPVNRRTTLKRAESVCQRARAVPWAPSYPRGCE